MKNHKSNSKFNKNKVKSEYNKKYFKTKSKNDLLNLQNHNSEKKSQYESFKNRYMNESRLEKMSYLSYQPNKPHKPKKFKENLLDESNLTKFGFDSEIDKEEIYSNFGKSCYQKSIIPNYKKSISKTQNDFNQNLIEKKEEKIKLENVLKTMRDNIGEEMNKIYEDMNLINDKYKKILPDEILNNDYYNELKIFQDRNMVLVIDFSNYLKNLNILKEKFSMIDEDYLSKNQQKSLLIEKLNNIENAIEKSVINFQENENSSQIIDKNIEIKNELKEMENESNELYKKFKEKEHLIFDLKREMFEKMKKTNEIFKKNTDVLSRNISFKKNFLEELDFEIFSCSKPVLYKFFEDIVNYDAIQYDKKIKNLKFNLNLESLEEIKKEFLLSINNIMVTFCQDNFVADNNFVILKNFSIQILHFIKESNSLFTENILTFQEVSKTKNLIDNLNIEFNQSKEQHQQIENLINLHKKEIKQAKSHLSKNGKKIDYNYLSESGRLDYFTNYQDSLSELELKKKINDIKYQEALSSIEIFGNESENLKKKINKIEKHQKNLITEKEKIKEILNECLSIKKKYILEIINIVSKEKENLKNFLNNILKTIETEILFEKVKEFIFLNIETNENFIEFLNYLNQSEIDLFIEGPKINEIIKIKKEYQDQNMNKKNFFKRELNLLKIKLKLLNEKEIPMLNKMNEDLKNLTEEINFIENKTNEEIRFIKKTFEKNSRCYFDAEFLKKIWINFREYYDLSLENIKKTLEEGFVVEQKANFNKNFDILKFLEVVELKKMRVSLEKFGFIKKIIQYDYSNDKVKLIDMKKGQIQTFSLNTFNKIQLSEFGIKMLKAKMPIFFKRSQLNLYSQKILKLCVNTKISELFIKEKNLKVSFIIKDFFILLCLLFSTQLNLIFEFENHL